MKWALIYWIVASGQGITTTATATLSDFETYEHCRQALKKIKGPKADKKIWIDGKCVHVRAGTELPATDEGG